MDGGIQPNGTGATNTAVKKRANPRLDQIYSILSDTTQRIDSSDSSTPNSFTTPDVITSQLGKRRAQSPLYSASGKKQQAMPVMSINEISKRALRSAKPKKDVPVQQSPKRALYQDLLTSSRRNAKTKVSSSTLTSTGKFEPSNQMSTHVSHESPVRNRQRNIKPSTTIVKAQAARNALDENSTEIIESSSSAESQGTKKQEQIEINSSEELVPFGTPKKKATENRINPEEPLATPLGPIDTNVEIVSGRHSNLPEPQVLATQVEEAIVSDTSSASSNGSSKRRKISENEVQVLTTITENQTGSIADGHTTSQSQSQTPKGSPLNKVQQYQTHNSKNISVQSPFGLHFSEQKTFENDEFIADTQIIAQSTATQDVDEKEDHLRNIIETHTPSSSPLRGGPSLKNVVKNSRVPNMPWYSSSDDEVTGLEKQTKDKALKTGFGSPTAVDHKGLLSSPISRRDITAKDENKNNSQVVVTPSKHVIRQHLDSSSPAKKQVLFMSGIRSPLNSSPTRARDAVPPKTILRATPKSNEPSVRFKTFIDESLTKDSSWEPGYLLTPTPNSDETRYGIKYCIIALSKKEFTRRYEVYATLNHIIKRNDFLFLFDCIKDNASLLLQLTGNDMEKIMNDEEFSNDPLQRRIITQALNVAAFILSNIVTNSPDGQGFKVNKPEAYKMLNLVIKILSESTSSKNLTTACVQFVKNQQYRLVNGHDDFLFTSVLFRLTRIKDCFKSFTLTNAVMEIISMFITKYRNNMLSNIENWVPFVLGPLISPEVHNYGKLLKAIDDIFQKVVSIGLERNSAEVRRLCHTLLISDTSSFSILQKLTNSFSSHLVSLKNVGPIIRIWRSINILTYGFSNSTSDTENILLLNWAEVISNLTRNSKLSNEDLVSCIDAWKSLALYKSPKTAFMLPYMTKTFVPNHLINDITEKARFEELDTLVQEAYLRTLFTFIEALNNELVTGKGHESIARELASKNYQLDLGYLHMITYPLVSSFPSLKDKGVTCKSMSELVVDDASSIWNMTLGNLADSAFYSHLSHDLIEIMLKFVSESKASYKQNMRVIAGMCSVVKDKIIETDNLSATIYEMNYCLKRSNVKLSVGELSDFISCISDSIDIRETLIFPLSSPRWSLLESCFIDSFFPNVTSSTGDDIVLQYSSMLKTLGLDVHKFFIKIASSPYKPASEASRAWLRDNVSESYNTKSDDESVEESLKDMAVTQTAPDTITPATEPKKGFNEPEGKQPNKGNKGTQYTQSDQLSGCVEVQGTELTVQYENESTLPVETDSRESTKITDSAEDTEADSNSSENHDVIIIKQYLEIAGQFGDSLIKSLSDQQLDTLTDKSVELFTKLKREQYHRKLRSRRTS